MSDVFAFTLISGKTYDIGAVADTATVWSRDGVQEIMGTLQNLAPLAIPNFTSFASPGILNGDSGHAGGFDGAVRLFVPDPPPPSSVPEPSSLGLLLIGTLVSRLFLVRRRSSLAVASAAREIHQAIDLGNGLTIQFSRR